MKLSSFLKRHKCSVVLLMFNSKGVLKTKEYSKQELGNIPQEFLDREVMESNYEDEVLEIWIR